MSYRCNRQERCRHLEIGYDVTNMLNGDSHVSSPQWRCTARDDERCVPNCKLYVPEWERGGDAE